MDVVANPRKLRPRCSFDLARVCHLSAEFLGSLMIRVAPHIRSLTPPTEDHVNNFVDEAGNCPKTHALNPRSTSNDFHSSLLARTCQS